MPLTEHTINDALAAMLRTAASLERAGRLAEAEAAYERLLACWPDLPDSWFNLAVLQRKARRFEAALASYQQALDRGVTQPEEVHLNRGVIYSDCLRRDDAAEAELMAARPQSALRPGADEPREPQIRPRPARRRHRALQAESLTIDPRCQGASRATRARAGVRTGRSDDRGLEQALADPGAGPADKASLGFALGKALDACGAFDQAFDAYAAANRAAATARAPGAILYDRRRHERFVDQLIATFGRDLPVAGAAASPVRPIFICGMFRSGSTLTEQVLAAHSGVTAGGEIDFIPTLVREELAPFPARVVGLAPAQLDALADRYLAALSKLYPGTTRVTDKRPDNFLYIGLIKRLFPHARIIHTTRDPLDNCLSIHFLHVEHGMGYALDLMDTAHYYAQYRRLMAHWKSLYGADILDFDYDAFVREPRPAVEKLLRFCGLDWEESCMAFERVANAVKPPASGRCGAALSALVRPLAQRATPRQLRLSRGPARPSGPGLTGMTARVGAARLRVNRIRGHDVERDGQAAFRRRERNDSVPHIRREQHQPPGFGRM
jgi:tetratricopeptide (TPR) repeat protein